MATEFCPECHQPMTNVVDGVRLPKFKATLLDYIESHPGQSGNEIGQHFGRGQKCIQSHIYQLNDALMNTGLRVQGGYTTGYHLYRCDRGADG